MNEIVRNAIAAHRAKNADASMSDVLGFLRKAPFTEVVERDIDGIDYTSTLFPKRKAADVRRKIEAYASRRFDVAKCKFSLCEDDSADDTWFWIASFPLSVAKNSAVGTVAKNAEETKELSEKFRSELSDHIKKCKKAADESARLRLRSIDKLFDMYKEILDMRGGKFGDGVKKEGEAILDAADKCEQLLRKVGVEYDELFRVLNKVEGKVRG